MRRQLLACGLLLALASGCSGQSPAPAPTTHVVTQTVTPTFTPTTAQPPSASAAPSAKTSTAAPTQPAPATSQAATPVTSASTTDPLETEPGRVLSVYDGDTITVEISSGSESIRILGIQAPERENKNLKIVGECYGEESGTDLRAKLVGADVLLTIDPEQGDGPDYRDKFGRLLRYVSAVTNGANLDVGAYQLQAGNAWVYEEYPVSKTPDYMRIMAIAQDNHEGLWAACE